jgi:hypothetical protein
MQWMDADGSRKVGLSIASCNGITVCLAINQTLQPIAFEVCAQVKVMVARGEHGILPNEMSKQSDQPVEPVDKEANNGGNKNKLARHVSRSVAHVALDVGVGPNLHQQHTHCLLVITTGSHVERSHPQQQVVRVDVSPVLHQEPHARLVTIQGGTVQRGVAALPYGGHV